MPGYAGFDRSAYPGDGVMDWLSQNTNLVWCGYYLAPAPSHADTSWMGKLELLQESSWGFAPVFVGQQVTGPGSHNVTAAAGTADGKSAASLMSSEGFDAGSCVFLDLENGPPLEQPQQDYVAAWSHAVEAAGFLPGIYCSHLLALAVHTLLPRARIWAFKIDTIQSHPVPNPYPDPNPSLCGYIGASAWQLGQNCQIRVGPAPFTNLTVDLSSSISSDPSAPE